MGVGWIGGRRGVRRRGRRVRGRGRGGAREMGGWWGGGLFRSWEVGPSSRNLLLLSAGREACKRGGWMNYIYLHRSHAFMTLRASAITDGSAMKSSHRIHFPLLFPVRAFDSPPTYFGYLIATVRSDSPCGRRS